MLNNLIKNYILSSLLKSLKGKKRWLVIIVLAVAYAVQYAGVDVGSFVADVINLLETAES